MTTREFIERALQGTTRKTHCSSVFVDNNVVYSYGYHYPLVVILQGKAFVNTRGYSVTTGKHIGWAMGAAANIVGWDNVYHAPTTTGLSKDGILSDAQKEYDRLTAEMDAKKRKDTRVYEWLEYQRERMARTIEAAKQLS